MIAAFLLVAALAQDSVIVDARYRGSDGGAVRGTPTYRTIGAALQAAPERNGKPFRIHIRDGRYYEKLSVDKPYIYFVGQSRTGTILTYDAAAGHRPVVVSRATRRPTRSTPQAPESAQTAGRRD